VMNAPSRDQCDRDQGGSSGTNAHGVLSPMQTGP
jgi:hypothetical protein